MSEGWACGDLRSQGTPLRAHGRRALHARLVSAHGLPCGYRHQRHLDVARRIASSGREAVALCEHDQFDLVLCDVMMPNLSGPQVYEELAKRSPGMQHRVLFMTGGAFTAAERQFLDRVPNKWIAKPLDVNQLRSLVGELLSEWDGERPG
ncbi:MAG TPA: response regulator [Polyangiaceae bacterium]|nr:response regulator [Polyangiaceae bacterium]